MKVTFRFVLPGLLVIAGIIGFVTYKNSNSPIAKGERLAQQYCAACHAFPDPALLDKTTWDKQVLPQMAFRMGFKDNNILYGFDREDLKVILPTLPSHPMISSEQLELIRQYYLAEAPGVLNGGQPDIAEHTTLFDAKAITSFRKPFNILVKYDSVSQQFYIGTALSYLYKLDQHFSIIDSSLLKSPPTWIDITTDDIYVSAVGRLLPTDQRKGYLAHADTSLDTVSTVIDSLKRPVFFERTDLNRDGSQDFIICTFGNYTGELAIYYGRQDDRFEKKVLTSTPGARKVTAIDWNRDGITDVVAQFAQGNERISVFIGNAGGTFIEKNLVHFPSVYGSSNYEIVDFNKDGYPDLITTNGDNGDYSNIVKPYHGIRIFLNNGKYELNEKFFFPMAGAWETRTVDFDQDGDLDIAAISFFPDNKEHPGQNFIYLENIDDFQFTAQTEPLSIHGIWMAMDAGDFDRDGDVDLVLGSCRFQGAATTNRQKGGDFIHLLLLDNKSAQHNLP